MLQTFIQKGLVFKSKESQLGHFNLDRWFRNIFSKTETVTTASALCEKTHITLLVTTAATAYSLPAACEGTEKFIKLKTDGGDATLTPSSLQGGTTITFNDADDFVLLKYIDGKYHVLSNSGCTIA
jgi:hypothetical protein